MAGRWISILFMFTIQKSAAGTSMSRSRICLPEAWKVLNRKLELIKGYSS